MKTHLIAAAALASIISAYPARPAHALDEHDSYRPFGAGPLTCGSFARALDGLDPSDKDSPKVTFTNYKRFVNGWLTAADRFIPGLNDATGGRDADWFTGVLVNHCRANPSLTIADALEQIINIRFPRLLAEKAPPLTYRSTAPAAADAAIQQPQNSWDAEVDRVTALSSRQNHGTPLYLHFCEPKFKQCSDVLAYKNSDGLRVFLQVHRDIHGAAINHLVCKLNEMEDIRVCADFDTGVETTAMQDMDGNWQDVTDSEPPPKKEPKGAVHF